MPSRRRGSFGRGGHEGAEGVTPEWAAKDRSRVGRFMAWLGFGPEEEPSVTPPAERPAEPQRPVSTPRHDDAPPPTPPGVAKSVEGAERRASEQITALEGELEQAKEEAARLKAELGRERAAAEERARLEAEAEAELAATRGQLDEALERAAAAEGRATEIEAERRGEMGRLREELVVAQQRQEAEQVEQRAGPEASEPVHRPLEPVEPEPLTEPDEPERIPGMVSLSNASLEDLRSLGMSVTQAKRVIDYRERIGGFDSIDDLDHVPGFPRALLAQIKEGVTL
jgi:DNA uptake protein ComE-like DNA-binding protein